MWRVLAGSAIFFTACGPDPVRPNAANYDASCVTVADCAVAVQQNTCGGRCDDATCLSVDGAALLEADHDAYVDDVKCDVITTVTCTQPPDPVCDCVASTCVAVETSAR